MTTDLAPLTHDEAERLTERIRTALDRVASSWSDLAERVTEAFDRRADRALGYASWAEYAEAELKPSSTLAIEVRRELVGLLSARGMSTRAIAPAMGVDYSTVSRDQSHVLHDATPAEPRPEAPSYPVTDVTGWSEDDVQAMEIADEAEQDAHVERLAEWEARQPKTTTGLDGKSYTRPEPREIADRRPPLIRKIESKIHRVMHDAMAINGAVEDDRFRRNSPEFAYRFDAPLRNAIEQLAQFIDALDLPQHLEEEEARRHMATSLNHISETFQRLAQSLTEESK